MAPRERSGVSGRLPGRHGGPENRVGTDRSRRSAGRQSSLRTLPRCRIVAVKAAVKPVVSSAISSPVADLRAMAR